MAQLFDQSITEVAVLKGFRKLFELVQNKNVLHHMFFGLLEAALDYDIAAVFFNDKNREPRHLAFHVAHNFEISEGQFEVWTQEIFENLQAKAAEPWLFKSTRYEVIQAEYMVEGKPLSIKQQLVVPFELEGEMVGAIAFFNRKEINYDIIFPYNLLMQEISVLMRLRRYFSEAEMLAISDPLTGLYTHQHFLWCLEREIRQAKRHKTPLTLVNISVEDIREMNAQWGHKTGDQAIINVASLMLQSVRNVDLLSRAGTRTIMALFPNTDTEAAKIPLERMQKLIAENPMKWNNQEIPLHLIVGVATLDDTIHSASELIAVSQQAVDQARSLGQNSVDLLK